MNPERLAAGLRRTLAELSALVPAERSAWRRDRLLRLAVMKLWIDAGNYADAYRKAMGFPVRTEPWSSLVGYRGMLAHQLPEDLDADRLWYDVREVPALRDDVVAALRTA